LTRRKEKESYTFFIVLIVTDEVSQPIFVPKIYSVCLAAKHGLSLVEKEADHDS
jgi:hypothetical protein